MSESGMSAAVAALPVNADEHRALQILAELYSVSRYTVFSRSELRVTRLHRVL